ncbi:MAG TPA: hypothetical protein VFE48_07315 [Methylomirabilota bacterium]|nr:hypothetical protein [Methylomirabilota bacterium]
MRHRLIGIILGLGTGMLLGGQLVIGTERIDLHDTDPKQTGYVIVDPGTRPLETYDTKSKCTRWGTIARESGDVEAFDRDGNWVGTGTLPPSHVKR